MANLRLYRQFYNFSFDFSGNTIQTLIDPYYLSASTYLASSSTVIESFIPTQESLGVYYVDLNPGLYSYSNTYDVRWYVNYLSIAPQKMLPTRFKLNPINVGGGNVELEIDNYPIEIEIAGLGF